jgi:trk system potassium uptake protein TrkH
MNFRLISSFLGVVAWLIGVTMCFSLPWAWPAWGGQSHFERVGSIALLSSIAVSVVVGLLLRYLGRTADGAPYRKEAMAIVGLSWVLATLLGGLPFYLSGTAVGLSVDDPSVAVPMSFVDCMFESQSGFSTTGATVLTDIEDEQLVPRCILFWRSSTHFLGGLGIIVLFVAVLGHGSAGKALLLAEKSTPTKEGMRERIQHTAWMFAGIYFGLNVMLTLLLKLEGPWTAQGTMSWFDALCHAFGTIATGGFSTYNSSVGHFDSAVVDYTITVFMILSGTNFVLLYFVCLGKPIRLFRDPEWRAYLIAITVVTLVIVAASMYWYDDFDKGDVLPPVEEFAAALRYGSFNVISIITTTGYATSDFDSWNQVSRAILFLLMFVGGCSGSTSGGIKVIRHLLLVKILGLEVEQSFRPRVVRHLRLGGEPITDPDLRKNVLVFFCMVIFIFMISWSLVVALEGDASWTDRGMSLDNKMVDAASAVIACYSNVGPGLGTVGPMQNYSFFDGESKFVLIMVMMLGRLEVFSVVVLFLPSFWRSR